MPDSPKRVGGASLSSGVRVSEGFGEVKGAAGPSDRPPLLKVLAALR